MALRAARKLHQKLPGALLDKLLFGKHICKSPLCHWESLTRTAHQGPGFAVTAGSRFSKVPVSRSGTLSRAEAALQPCNSGAARWQHLVAAAGCAGRRVYATSSAAAGRAGAAAGAAEVLGFGKPGGGGGEEDCTRGFFCLRRRDGASERCWRQLGTTAGATMSFPRPA